ncbi:universal stress protein Sll1654-like [Sycon ciliatum]|uniref:universal stress protein Sll1654-like n=1 Tax=Sycon ciliatum TaxID=27933 RepID=UPI0020AA754D|eukprot:scpid81106/ scgid16605/ Universal stress protein Sll1654
MAADGSRFKVEAVDREQLSVRSLGELLELQKLAEENSDQTAVQSLGELLADTQSGSPSASRARTGSNAEGRQRSSSALSESQLRPRTLSGAGSLIRPDRSIVLGLDGSEECRTAFHWYLDELRKDGDQLLLVHIFETPSLPILSLKSGLSIPSDVWQAKIKESTAAAEKLMSQYEAACMSHKVNYQTVIRSGVPGEMLCKVAEERAADFMVLGCRGRSLLRRTVLGSVSTFTINHTSIPVMVVPHPLKRRERH